jgi:hypothetical protein
MEEKERKICFNAVVAIPAIILLSGCITISKGPDWDDAEDWRVPDEKIREFRESLDSLKVVRHFNDTSIASTSTGLSISAREDLESFLSNLSSEIYEAEKKSGLLQIICESLGQSFPEFRSYETNYENQFRPFDIRIEEDLTPGISENRPSNLVEVNLGLIQGLSSFLLDGVYEEIEGLTPEQYRERFEEEWSRSDDPFFSPANSLFTLAELQVRAGVVETDYHWACLFLLAHEAVHMWIDSDDMNDMEHDGVSGRERGEMIADLYGMVLSFGMTGRLQTEVKWLTDLKIANKATADSLIIWSPGPMEILSAIYGGLRVGEGDEDHSPLERRMSNLQAIYDDLLEARTNEDIANMGRTRRLFRTLSIETQFQEDPF